MQRACHVSGESYGMTVDRTGVPFVQQKEYEHDWKFELLMLGRRWHTPTHKNRIESDVRVAVLCENEWVWEQNDLQEVCAFHVRAPPYSLGIASSWSGK